MDSIKQYLSSDGTCKCGLKCPLQIDSTFSFNTKVVNIKQTVSDSEINDGGKIKCKHKVKHKDPGIAPYPVSRPLAVSVQHEVSMVTSSGMMSPRVSSTLQENASNGNCYIFSK